MREYIAELKKLNTCDLSNDFAFELLVCVNQNDLQTIGPARIVKLVLLVFFHVSISNQSHEIRSDRMSHIISSEFDAFSRHNDAAQVSLRPCGSPIERLMSSRAICWCFTAQTPPRAHRSGGHPTLQLSSSPML